MSRRTGDIADKVAVVTGAGSGIGRHLALELATRRARLALCDLDEAGLAETVDLIKAKGAETHATTLDVSDREAVAHYAAAVVEHYGVVNQVYNNAGIAGGSTTVLDTDYAGYERTLNVNLWGVIHGTKEFLPHLIASGDGHVVNISSLNGYLAQGTLSAYCASKFAVRGFTESLRYEMLQAGHRVRVTVVHPGGVATNIASSALADAERNGVEVSDEQRRRVAVYNDKLLRTPPEKAAAIILDGVQAGRSRVLVGSDAKAVDWLVRLAPSLSTRLVAQWDRRLFR